MAEVGAPPSFWAYGQEAPMLPVTDILANAWVQMLPGAAQPVVATLLYYLQYWRHDPWYLLVPVYLTSLGLVRRWAETTKYSYRAYQREWKWVMCAYNLGMALFSFVCAVMMIKALFEVPAVFGLGHYESENYRFWAWIFYFSKYVEFADTFFLILMGRPVIWLQYLHHAGAPLDLGMWYYGKVEGIWIYVVFNGFIHTVMYYYYACGVMKWPFPWKQMITNLQLVQFAAGLGVVSLYCWVPGFLDDEAKRLGFWFNWCYVWMNTLMFLNFYLQTYVFKKSQRKKGEPVKDAAAGAGASAAAEEPRYTVWYKGVGIKIDARWERQHPGGDKVFKIFHNRDATDQLLAMHSEEAQRKIEAMARASDPDAVRKMAEHEPSDYEVLYKKAKEAGYFKPHLGHEVWKAVYCFGSVILGCYLLLQHTDQMAYLGGFFIAFGWYLLGWLGHDWSHHTYLPKSTSAFCTMIDTVQCAANVCRGNTLLNWKLRHNTHHVCTNELENDPDIRTTPAFFFVEDFVPNEFTLRQHWYYLPVLSLLQIYWIVESFFVNLSKMRSRNVYNRKWARLDLLAQLGHAVFIGGLLHATGRWDAVLFAYLCSGFMTGIVVFASHYAEQRFHGQEAANMSLIEQTSKTVRNISGFSGYQWEADLWFHLTGGLNIQFEHHCFPMMPRCNLRRMTRDLKAVCTERGWRFQEDNLYDCTVLCVQKLQENTSRNLARLQQQQDDKSSSSAMGGGKLEKLLQRAKKSSVVGAVRTLAKATLLFWLGVAVTSRFESPLLGVLLSGVGLTGFECARLDAKMNRFFPHKLGNLLVEKTTSLWVQNWASFLFFTVFATWAAQALWGAGTLSGSTLYSLNYFALPFLLMRLNVFILDRKNLTTADGGGTLKRSRSSNQKLHAMARSRSANKLLCSKEPASPRNLYRLVPGFDAKLFNVMADVEAVTADGKEERKGLSVELFGHDTELLFDVPFYHFNELCKGISATNLQKLFFEEEGQDAAAEQKGTGSESEPEPEMDSGDAEEPKFLGSTMLFELLTTILWPVNTMFQTVFMWRFRDFVLYGVVFVYLLSVVFSFSNDHYRLAPVGFFLLCAFGKVLSITLGAGFQFLWRITQPGYLNKFMCAYMGLVHAGALYGVLLCAQHAVGAAQLTAPESLQDYLTYAESWIPVAPAAGATLQWKTILFACALWPISGIGITGGAHRLWAHRSYEAHWPVRVLLMLCNSVANQGPIYHWARDHRTHHIHSDTELDPHNAKYGWFYSHMGWLLTTKDPKVVENGRALDISDLKADPVVMFQKKLDPWWNFFFCFAVPALVAQYGWGESFWNGFIVACVTRYCFVLHFTWAVNSIVHVFGPSPYGTPHDVYYATESRLVSFFAIGEGWHSWHHAFPHDYAAAELGVWYQWNPTKAFIDTFALLGLVWNRKRGTRLWEARKQLKTQGREQEVEVVEKLVGPPFFKIRQLEVRPKQPALSVSSGVFDQIEDIKEWEQKVGVTKESIMSAIPARLKHRSLLWSSLFIVRDLTLCGLVALTAFYTHRYWLAETLAQSRALSVLFWGTYAVVQGTVATGLWVVGHECGHHAFCEYDTVSDLVGFLVHTPLLVPFFSWQFTHGKHHKYTNHMVDGETHVPATKPAWYVKAAADLLGEDVWGVLDAQLHLLFGWPLYLVFNLTGGRSNWKGERFDKRKPVSHFVASQSDLFPPNWRQRVRLSALGFYGMCGLLALWAYHHGFTTVFQWYGAPLLIVNAWLVLYTWLQHTHPDIPHFGEQSFSWLRGALATVDRPYPWLVDQLHHHIGSTHVLHHFSFKIPHYHAEEATEILKNEVGPDLYRYDPRPVWQALWEAPTKCQFVSGVNGLQWYKGIKDMKKTPAARKSAAGSDDSDASPGGTGVSSLNVPTPARRRNVKKDGEASGKNGAQNGAVDTQGEQQTSDQLLAAGGKKEMIIFDRVVDVTTFAKKHPGGRIIEFQLNTDATDAFREFHFRSERAHKLLKALPSREITDEDRAKLEGPAVNDAFTMDFRKLREELKAEGYYEPNLLHVAMRISELVGLHVIGVALAMAGWYGAGLVCLGVAQGRCGWFMHEGGHGSLTGSHAVDKRIQEFFYGVGCGMGAAWWRNQHNKHHATPQKMKHDVDLDTLPLVAFNARVLTESRAGKALMKSAVFRHVWLPLQKVLFAPLICLLVALFWQLYLHPRHALRTRNYIEVFWMGTRYALWFGLATQVINVSFGTALAAYLFYVQAGASYIFCNFAVSHTHLDVVDSDDHRSWADYSAEHTMNCTNCLGVNWWMSYLNFQIEHHLFPQMPQYRFPQISDRVRALFEKHGREYKCMGYFAALHHTYKNLEKVAQEALSH